MPLPDVYCADGHPERPARVDEFTHDDGTVRITYRCTRCGLNLGLRDETRTTLFAPIVAANVERVALSLLCTANNRGMTHARNHPTPEENR